MRLAGDYRICCCPSNAEAVLTEKTFVGGLITSIKLLPSGFARVIPSLCVVLPPPFLFTRPILLLLLPAAFNQNGRRQKGPFVAPFHPTAAAGRPAFSSFHPSTTKDGFPGDESNHNNTVSCCSLSGVSDL